MRLIDLSKVALKAAAAREKHGWDDTRSYAIVAICVANTIDRINGWLGVPAIGKSGQRPPSRIDIDEILMGEQRLYTYVYTQTHPWPEDGPDGAIVCTWAPVVFVTDRYGKGIKLWLERFGLGYVQVVSLKNFNDKALYISDITALTESFPRAYASLTEDDPNIWAQPFSLFYFTGSTV